MRLILLLAALGAVLVGAEARAQCLTVNDVIARLGPPTTRLAAHEVRDFSRQYAEVYGKPLVASDEALVYDEYLPGPAAAVRMILFRDGCGLRDGGMPRQIYLVLMAKVRERARMPLHSAEREPMP